MTNPHSIAAGAGAPLPPVGPTLEAAAYRAEIAAKRRARFVAEATAVGATVEVVPPAAVAEAIAARVAEIRSQGCRVGLPAGAWNEAASRWPSVEAIGALLASRGHVASRWPLPGGGLAGVEDLDAGITEAAWALAETGTLVLSTASAAPRSLSLLPPLHVAIVDASRIVVDLHDVLAGWAKDPPSAVTFITGPSRSADIEMSLTVGVHGPAAVHIIVVADLAS